MEVIERISVPACDPLLASSEYDDLEAQLKQLTIELIEEYIRAHERELNAYGMPHLASMETIERWVKEDGLSMVRSNSEAAMRYLFRAWKTRNPKRGLHFLRTYMQLLWPNAWSVVQLWHRKDAPYPTALVSPVDTPGIPDMSVDHYLTSRVNIDVSADDEDGTGLSGVSRALRSTLAAKFVVVTRMLRVFQSDVGVVMTLQSAHSVQAATVI